MDKWVKAMKKALIEIYVEEYGAESVGATKERIGGLINDEKRVY